MGSDLLNSLQVQGRGKDGEEEEEEEWREIATALPPPPQHNGPFLHVYPPRYLAKLLQAFASTRLQEVSYLFSLPGDAI